MKKIIENALPNCLIKEVKNFDDFHTGYEVAPVPGVMLQIKQMTNDKLSLIIEYYEFRTYLPDTGVGFRKRIFIGEIPANKNDTPDFDFIEKIIANYHLFR